MRYQIQIAYYCICIKHIICNKTFITILYLLDYFIIWVHYSEILQNVSMTKAFSDGIIKASPLYHFRLLRSLDIYSYGQLSYGYLIIVISLVISCIGVLLKYSIGLCRNTLQLFIVNLNEYLLLRLMTVFLMDVFINDAITSLDFNAVYSLCIMIYLIGYICYSMNHIRNYYLFNYAETEYPFNSLSTYFDISLYIMKIMICIEAHIPQDNILLKRVICLMISLIIIASICKVITDVYSNHFYLNHNLYINWLIFSLQIIVLFLPMIYYLNIITGGFFYLSALMASILFLLWYNNHKPLFSHCLSSYDYYGILMEMSSVDNVNDSLFLMKSNYAIHKHYEQCQSCSLCHEILIRNTSFSSIPYNYIDLYTLFNKVNGYNKELLELRQDMIMQSCNKTAMMPIVNQESIANVVKEDFAKLFNIKLKLLRLIKLYLNKDFNTYLNLNMINEVLLKYHHNEENRVEVTQLHLINDFILDTQASIESLKQLCDDHNYPIKDYYKTLITINILQEEKYLSILTSKQRLKTSMDYTFTLLFFIHQTLFNVINPDNAYPLKEMLIAMEEVIDQHFTNDRLIAFRIDFFSKDTKIILCGKEIIKYLHKNIEMMFPFEFADYQLNILLSLINENSSSVNQIKLILNHHTPDVSLDITQLRMKKKQRNFNINSFNVNMKLFDMITLEGELMPSLDSVNDYHTQFIYSGKYSLDLFELIIINMKGDNALYGMTLNLYEQFMNNNLQHMMINDREWDNEHETVKYSSLFDKIVDILGLFPTQLNTFYTIEDYYKIYLIANFCRLPKRKKNRIEPAMNYFISSMTNSVDQTNSLTIPLINNQTGINTNKHTHTHTNNKTGKQNNIPTQIIDRHSLKRKISPKYTKNLHRKNAMSILRKSIPLLQRIQEQITMQLVIYLCIFSIVLVSIIGFYYEEKEHNQLLNSHELFDIFLNTSRIYFTGMSSFLSVACIGQHSSVNCVNHLDQFNQRFLRSHPQITLNFTEFIHKENLIILNLIYVQTKLLWNNIYSIGDENMTQVFLQNFEYHQVIPSKAGIRIQVKNVPAIDMLKIIVNSLTVILKSKAYMTSPVYIISFLPKIDLGNIYRQEVMSEWQVEYYNILINYFQFMRVWFRLHTGVHKTILLHVAQTFNVGLVFFFLIGGIEIGLIIIVVYSEYLFLKEQKKELNQINMILTDGDFVSRFIGKLNTIKTMALLYKKNPVALIRDYDRLTMNNHCLMTSYTTKNTKTKTKAVTITLDTKPPNNELQKEYILRRGFSMMELYVLYNRDFYILIGILCYYLIHLLFFFSLFDHAIQQTLKIIYYTQERAYAEETVFSDFVLWQLMYYGNTTQTEISSFMTGQNPEFFHLDLVRAMETLSSSGRQSLFTMKESITYDCDSLYSTVDDVILSIITKEEPTFPFFPELKKICEVLGVFAFEEEVIAYKIYFNKMNTPLRLAKKDSYENIEEALRRDDLHYASIIGDFIIRPLRYGLSALVMKRIIENVAGLLNNILISNMVICIIVNIAVSGFIWLLNKDSKKRQRTMKDFAKVFKI